MNREDFIKLSLAQKTEALWNHGELISEKAYYDYNITLFLLDTFYVEIFFDRVEKEIVSVSLQENTQILFGYVKDLKLDELVGAQD
jgi:hypothetical protein